MTCRGMITRVNLLYAVSYLAPGRFRKILKLREILTKIENILTHWSVAQAGSNKEKYGGRKSRWTVSLNIVVYLNILYCTYTFIV